MCIHKDSFMIVTFLNGNEINKSTLLMLSTNAMAYRQLCDLISIIDFILQSQSRFGCFKKKLPSRFET